MVFWFQEKEWFFDRMLINFVDVNNAKIFSVRNDMRRKTRIMQQAVCIESIWIDRTSVESI